MTLGHSFFVIFNFCKLQLLLCNILLPKFWSVKLAGTQKGKLTCEKSSFSLVQFFLTVCPSGSFLNVLSMGQCELCPRGSWNDGVDRNICTKLQWWKYNWKTMEPIHLLCVVGIHLIFIYMDMEKRDCKKTVSQFLNVVASIYFCVVALQKYVYFLGGWCLTCALKH